MHVSFSLHAAVWNANAHDVRVHTNLKFVSAQCYQAPPDRTTLSRIMNMDNGV